MSHCTIAEQNVINRAIEWAEVQYLRKDLDTSEVLLLEEVNNLLEEIDKNASTSSNLKTVIRNMESVRLRNTENKGE